MKASNKPVSKKAATYMELKHLSNIYKYRADKIKEILSKKDKKKIPAGEASFLC